MKARIEASRDRRRIIVQIGDVDHVLSWTDLQQWINELGNVADEYDAGTVERAQEEP